MNANLKAGDYVVWRWGYGYGHGQVVSVDPSRVEIISKGRRISRNGTADNPAVIIVDHNGARVLKLASEVEKAN